MELGRDGKRWGGGIGGFLNVMKGKKKVILLKSCFCACGGGWGSFSDFI